jgi:hypothetical protein
MIKIPATYTAINVVVVFAIATTLDILAIVCTDLRRYLSFHGIEAYVNYYCFFNPEECELQKAY